MPNTKMTREKLKVHFHYSKVLYAVIIIVAVMIGNFTYTVTTYQPPNERRIDIELIGNYADTGTEKAASAASELLAAGQEYELKRDEAQGLTGAEDYEIPLQSVQFLSIQYDPESNTEEAYYAAQKYMVTLAAQEGDVYVVTRTLMTQLAEQNLLMSLDGYIESGVIDPGDRNLDKVRLDAYDDEGNASGEQKIFALQADTLTGLYDAMTYDPTGKYLCIVQFCRNPDTAAAVIQEMIDIFEPDEAESDGGEQAGEAGA